MNMALYTDGGCHGNPGPGGWAFHLRWKDSSGEGEKSLEHAGYVPDTTNNRMELTAVIIGLEYAEKTAEETGIQRNIDLFTDSQYVQKGITEWILNWKSNGWKTSGKKPVKNRDLWQTLDEKAQSFHIEWHWLKGHDGHIYNETCDRLVQQAINTGN